jgi:hypothetical protein
MHRLLAYADAMRTFAVRLTTLVEAQRTVTPADLHALLVEVCATGQASGLASESVAEQVDSTVRFLRTAVLARGDRIALAATAAAILLADWQAGDTSPRTEP